MLSIYVLAKSKIAMLMPHTSVTRTIYIFVMYFLNFFVRVNHTTRIYMWVIGTGGHAHHFWVFLPRHLTNAHIWWRSSVLSRSENRLQPEFVHFPAIWRIQNWMPSNPVCVSPVIWRSVLSLMIIKYQKQDMHIYKHIPVCMCTYMFMSLITNTSFFCIKNDHHFAENILRLIFLYTNFNEVWYQRFVWQ